MKHKQYGAALITALLIVAIVAAIAGMLMSRQGIDIDRSELNFDAMQAYQYIDYGNAWASTVYTELQKAPLAPKPKWPIVMPTLKIANATIDSELSSAQGRFNINNLTDSAYIPVFIQLMMNVDPNLSRDKAQEITNAIVSWIHPSTQPHTTDPYSKMQPPYRAAGRPMVSPSELRLVDGMTAKLYNELAPYIIALPSQTPIDPNSASIPVLEACGISDSAAQSVHNALKYHGGFSDIHEFYQLTQFRPQSGNNALEVFSLKSQYYLVQTTIKLDRINLKAYSILTVNKQKDGLVVIQQSQHTL